MVFPRKIPTTKPKKCLEQIVHQKISEEKSLPQKTRDIATKNFSQAKFLPKIPTRGSLYQKIFEETFFTKKCLKRNPYQTYLPRISAKNIYMKRQKRHSLPFFWRASVPKRNEETSLPKKLTINGYQKSKDISAKKFQEKFQQKRISQSAIFYQNNFMKNIDQQIFEE